MSVQEDTELVAAALRALVGRVTDPVLDELEALRVAVEVRCDAVTAALADPKELDPALHEVLDQFALAAREQTEAAAHAARIQAFEEAEIRWDFERATLEKRYEALQAEAAAAREADRVQCGALQDALQDAKVQADVIRERADTQVEAARIAQTQLLAETHAQIEAAHAETERALTAQRGLLDDTRGQLADAERAQADARQELDTARAESEKARAAEERVLDDTRAQLAEVQARLEEAQRAREAASQAAENAQTQLATVRAELGAHQASDAAARATLTEALEAARAQWDTVQTDTRSHLEAEHAAHATALADARAERDAANAERDVVRSERNAACVDRDTAYVDRDAAYAARDAAHAARSAAQEDRDAAQAARDAAQAEVSAARQAVSEAVAAPAPNPRAIAPLLDQLAGTVRTMDDAVSLTHVLDALLDGVGALFPRTAIFLVKADRLQGWRRVGGDPVVADTPPDVPLTAASPLTQALTTGRVIVADREFPADEPAPAGADVWTATLPIAVGHRVVALLQAEDRARHEDAPATQDRQTALTVSDLLVRHAGRCLASLTATAALPALVSASVTRPSSTADAAAPAPSRPGTTPRRRAGESPSIEDARRYARLLVSEIKRYNEANLGAGPRDATLYDRLKDDIERCRRLYAGRVPAELCAASNFFDDALLEILAGGDPDTLRRLEQRLEDGPLGPPSENRAETTSSR